MLKKIYTQNAPEAIGPYSQAIQYDKLLFSSGQIPVDPETEQSLPVELPLRLSRS